MTAGNAFLTMYTTTWCPHCVRLKTMLKAADIAYAEINIEHDPDSAAFVENANGGNRTVPTVRFADDSTLTNPSIKEVKVKVAELAG